MKDVLICPGCNYHTTWQSHRNMRFVLDFVNGSTAHMYTRNTKSRFTCKVKDLIFITSNVNIRKARRLFPDRVEEIDQFVQNHWKREKQLKLEKQHNEK